MVSTYRSTHHWYTASYTMFPVAGNFHYTRTLDNLHRSEDDTQEGRGQIKRMSVTRRAAARLVTLILFICVPCGELLTLLLAEDIYILITGTTTTDE